ncbi:DUF89 family protein [Candidatus Bathyarchaeota archaeon]|nr:DUF89 family protein [Candidatus Bathyarchaeota archaeon]
MKVEAECAACLLSRAAAQLTEATTNPALRFRTMSELLKLFSKEFGYTAVPARLGTKRDRLIRRITGSSDPYARAKKKSNQKAMKLLPYASRIVEEGYTQRDRFKKACLCAVVGNVMEFDIPGHRFTSTTLKKSFKEAAKDLVVNDIDKAYELAKGSRRVLYLADNAGEIVFDTLLVSQLKNMGLEVTFVVKGSPVLNDATLEDVAFCGIDKIADRIITTGTDAVGLSLKEVSPEFLKAYDEAELVFAKGMGYAETLTEYKLTKPHFLLFRTKCNPVANFFCTSRGRNIAKLMP